MNILLTCSGRRNYLVDYFKEALNGKGKVYTVNSTAEATSMIVADGAFVAPPLYEEGYIDYLIQICRQYRIKLLVPLFDMELPILASHKKRFEDIGVAMAVSDQEIVDICNDKVQTNNFVDKLGLRALFTTTEIEVAVKKINDGDVDFPLFIKPRWGMGSIALQQAETIDELSVLYRKVQRDLQDSYLKYYPNLDLKAAVIIQESARGTEYGLDVINDFNGRYKTTFVKKKMGMRSGETDGAITEDVPELQQLGKKIGEQLKHVGNLDVDVFWDGNNSVILEINNRFGGGYPFSHLAGANLPKSYLDWASNKTALEADLHINYGVRGMKALSMLNFNSINIIQEL